ncbi:MAG: hypothetical protein KAJ19_22885 [Gammaproteobacteria bacterium]|nr:hypothetical protein [Gammaproteobacteria bacterium]
MDWKIYYSDGSTFSDEDGDTLDAPSQGVQVITMRDKDHGRHMTARYDFYVWEDFEAPDRAGLQGEWFGIDSAGLLSYLLRVGFLRYSGYQKQVPYEDTWRDADQWDVIYEALQVGLIKAGQTISDDEHSRMIGWANSDPDFPSRTAWRFGEVQPD